MNRLIGRDAIFDLIDDVADQDVQNTTPLNSGASAVTANTVNWPGVGVALGNLVKKHTP